MAHFGYARAQRMYREVDGQDLHVGYVVGPHWCEVVRVGPFRDVPEGARP